MKTYRVSGNVASNILILGTWWRWLVSFILRPLYLRRNICWYSM